VRSWQWALREVGSGATGPEPHSNTLQVAAAAAES
jgi:hypothetical protein